MNPSHMSGGGKPPQQQQPGMLAQQLQIMRPQQQPLQRHQSPMSMQSSPMSVQSSPMSMPPSQSPGPIGPGGQMMHLGPPRAPPPPPQGIGSIGGLGGPPNLMQRTPLPPQNFHPGGMPAASIPPPPLNPSSSSAPQSLTPQQQQQLQRAQAQAALAQHPLSLLCRFGAEFTQEIVSRTLEAISNMRHLTLPTTVNTFNPAALEEKKAEVRKNMAAIRLCFERLRQMHERVGQIDLAQEMGEMKPTALVMEALIPFKEDDDSSDENEGDSEEEGDDRMLTGDSEAEGGELPSKKVKVEEHPSTSKIIGSGLFEAHRYRGPRIDDERRRRNPKIALLEAEHRDLLAQSQLKSRQIKEVIDRLRKLVWDINTCLAVSSST